MSEIVPEHVAGGAVAGAVLVQLVKWARGKRRAEATAAKTDAESAAVIAGAWESLLQPLRDEVERLGKEHKACEERATRQRADIEALKEEVEALKKRT